MEVPHSVLCLIPARGGSKGIPRKNLQPLGGRPLVVYSVAQALASRHIGRTLVSTDDEEIADVARRHGAEVPFLRPLAIAGDLSTDLEVFEHALGWLRAEEGYVPEICVHLRPTYPIRRVEDIDRMVELLAETPGLDSVRSITPAPESPFKMWFRGEDGLLSPVVTSELAEAYNLPRQQLPLVYLQSAAIDVVWTRVITDQQSMTGRAIHGYVMHGGVDIDTPADLARASREMSSRGRP
jgi:CMP-N-acetylneuraminic acid synthetase